MKIEAIIFDLGRVLVDVDFSGLFKKYINPDISPDFSFTLNDIMKESWFIDHSSGKMSSYTFYETLNDTYKMDISYTAFQSEWSSIFKPLPQMEALLKQTALRHPVGLLSDTDAIHWQYLIKTYPILQIFNKPILSFEIGVMKPDKLCYQKAAESVNTSIKRCLFIDDRLENVKGAINAGMQSVHFESHQKLLTFFKANSL